MSERASSFRLSPELAPSTSLVVSSPMSNNVAKMPTPAPTLNAAMVLIVLTVTVDTISRLRYY